MKHLANAITAGRIALCLLMPFFFGDAAAFAALYVLCGLSDVLDGVIARKTGNMTELGARLDTVADLLFFCVSAAWVCVAAWPALVSCLPWLGAVLVTRLAGMAIAAVKYRRFVILHTWANKRTGFLIFLAVPLFVLTHSAALVIAVCAVAWVAAVEECVLHLVSAHLDLNRRSLLLRK